MLFHSYEFALVFLPLVLVATALIRRWFGVARALDGVLVASLVFYGWDEPLLVGMLVGSVAFNFALGLAQGDRDPRRAAARHRLLWLGVTTNLALLFQFKYTNFAIEIWNALTGAAVAAQPMILPLAISFFTFQQIAYLVEVHRGEPPERDPRRYALFVCFFPHLIAGPIVHHREILPQFALPQAFQIDARRLAVGLTLFVLGLAKKVVVADNVALCADPVFAAAAAGGSISFADAWGGALAYTFQLYFDFSGYCDMALGAAYMVGVRFPFNFDSPYRATSVIDFWRRWHMTLSRFLRNYLYVPLGGNRRGRARRYVNLLVTMLLGGLWHGAGWTFVLWGAMHGLLLVLNHGLRALRPPRADAERPAWQPWVGRAVTFVAVVLAWVLFRADSVDAATRVYAAMLGFHGFAGPALESASVFGGQKIVFGLHELAALAALLAGVWLLPNSQHFMGIADGDADPPERSRVLAWSPSLPWAAWAALLFLTSLVGMSQAGEFVYFRF